MEAYSTEFRHNFLQSRFAAGAKCAMELRFPVSDMLEPKRDERVESNQFCSPDDTQPPLLFGNLCRMALGEHRRPAGHLSAKAPDRRSEEACLDSFKKVLRRVFELWRE